jgi:hypothetical protein
MAYAERLVRSIKHERLNRVIPFGDRHFRRMMAESVEYYHRERNRQDMASELIEAVAQGPATSAHSATPAARRVAQLLLSHCIVRRARQRDSSNHE